MKITAYHELDGSIREFVTFTGPSHAGMMLVTRPALVATELQGVTLKPGAKGIEQLRDIAKQEKILMPPSTWTVEKSSRSK